MGSYDQYRPQQIPDEDDVLWAAHEKRLQKLENAAQTRRKDKMKLLGGLAIAGLTFIGGVLVGSRKKIF